MQVQQRRMVGKKRFIHPLLKSLETSKNTKIMKHTVYISFICWAHITYSLHFASLHSRISLRLRIFWVDEALAPIGMNLGNGRQANRIRKRNFNKWRCNSALCYCILRTADEKIFKIIFRFQGLLEKLS